MRRKASVKVTEFNLNESAKIWKWIAAYQDINDTNFSKFFEILKAKLHSYSENETTKITQALTSNFFNSEEGRVVINQNAGDNWYAAGKDFVRLDEQQGPSNNDDWRKSILSRAFLCFYYSSLHDHPGALIQMGKLLSYEKYNKAKKGENILASLLKYLQNNRESLSPKDANIYLNYPQHLPFEFFREALLIYIKQGNIKNTDRTLTLMKTTLEGMSEIPAIHSVMAILNTSFQDCWDIPLEATADTLRQLLATQGLVNARFAGYNTEASHTQFGKLFDSYKLLLSSCEKNGFNTTQDACLQNLFELANLISKTAPIQLAAQIVDYTNRKSIELRASTTPRYQVQLAYIARINKTAKTLGDFDTALESIGLLIDQEDDLSIRLEAIELSQALNEKVSQLGIGLSRARHSELEASQIILEFEYYRTQALTCAAALDTADPATTNYLAFYKAAYIPLLQVDETLSSKLKEHTTHEKASTYERELCQLKIRCSQKVLGLLNGRKDHLETASSQGQGVDINELNTIKRSLKSNLASKHIEEATKRLNELPAEEVLKTPEAESKRSHAVPVAQSNTQDTRPSPAEGAASAATSAPPMKPLDTTTGAASATTSAPPPAPPMKPLDTTTGAASAATSAPPPAPPMKPLDTTTGAASATTSAPPPAPPMKPLNTTAGATSAATSAPLPAPPPAPPMKPLNTTAGAASETAISPPRGKGKGKGRGKGMSALPTPEPIKITAQDGAQGEATAAPAPAKEEGKSAAAPADHLNAICGFDKSKLKKAAVPGAKKQSQPATHGARTSATAVMDGTASAAVSAPPPPPPKQEEGKSAAAPADHLNAICGFDKSKLKKAVKPAAAKDGTQAEAPTPSSDQADMFAAIREIGIKGHGLRTRTKEEVAAEKEARDAAREAREKERQSTNPSMAAILAQAMAARRGVMNGKTSEAGGRSRKVIRAYTKEKPEGKASTGGASDSSDWSSSDDESTGLGMK